MELFGLSIMSFKIPAGVGGVPDGKSLVGCLSPIKVVDPLIQKFSADEKPFEIWLNGVTAYEGIDWEWDEANSVVCWIATDANKLLQIDDCLQFFCKIDVSGGGDPGGGDPGGGGDGVTLEQVCEKLVDTGVLDGNGDAIKAISVTPNGSADPVPAANGTLQFVCDNITGDLLYFVLADGTPKDIPTGNGGTDSYNTYNFDSFSVTFDPSAPPAAPPKPGDLEDGRFLSECFANGVRVYQCVGGALVDMGFKGGNSFTFDVPNADEAACGVDKVLVRQDGTRCPFYKQARPQGSIAVIAEQDPDNSDNWVVTWQQSTSGTFDGQFSEIIQLALDGVAVINPSSGQASVPKSQLTQCFARAIFISPCGTATVVDAPIVIKPCSAPRENGCVRCDVATEAIEDAEGNDVAVDDDVLIFEDHSQASNAAGGQVVVTYKTLCDSDGVEIPLPASLTGNSGPDYKNRLSLVIAKSSIPDLSLIHI